MQETQVRFLGREDPLKEGNGNPLQYSCLENAMDRGAWRATFHGVTRVGHDLAIHHSKIVGNLKHNLKGQIKFLRN